MRMHDRRAEFSDDNTGCTIGEADRSVERGAPSHGDRERGDHRVTGTADIKHFTRLRRRMPSPSPGGEASM